MKRTLLTIALITLSFCAFAQEHLTFKGVPIDGTRKEFIENMKKKGFHNAYSSKDAVILDGEFALEHCRIIVSTAKEKDVVSRITVNFPDKYTWSELLGDYTALEEMLKEKYGRPKKSVHAFKCGKPDKDEIQDSDVDAERCRYMTLFITSVGEIEMKVNDYNIQLQYRDRVNSDAARAAAMEDL